VNLRRFNPRDVAVNDQHVPGFKREIFFRLRRKRAGKVDVEDLQLAACKLAVDLRVFELAVGSGAASQIDCIGNMGFAIGAVFPGTPYFTAHGYCGRIFKLVPAKHPHRVKRLQKQVLFAAGKRVRQLEGGSSWL